MNRSGQEFRRKEVLRNLLRAVERRAARLDRGRVRVMEVCGTHTMTIHRYGLKELLERAGVDMVSGPGCPVCITPGAVHEAAIALVTGKPNLLLATFGDMTRVPTGRGSLQTVIPGPGSMVKVVYSPQESVVLAAEHPDKEVVFFGAGFETTIPSIAAALRAARQAGLGNYSVLGAMWLIPPPLRAILEAGEVKISGFLYPGHVSAIIGLEPYGFIAREFGLPGSVAGFEPADILLGILDILDQLEKGRPGVGLEYARAVAPDGNRIARLLMDEVLEVKDATWRGLGPIPRSGLKPRDAFAAWDAERKFDLRIKAEAGDLRGCRCGEVLRGLIAPPQCALFGRSCLPDSPQGPCMVSYEGACLVFYKYALRKSASATRPGKARSGGKGKAS
jgi:hydrogenase expression/formation protein HypD